jgi:hypothetical protein
MICRLNRRSFWWESAGDYGISEAAGIVTNWSSVHSEGLGPSLVGLPLS